LSHAHCILTQIPEALGLASGVVFLVCIVLFQQLHHWDLPAALQAALGGGQPPPPLSAAAADAWMVDYNAALATICFMLFLGGCQFGAPIRLESVI